MRGLSQKALNLRRLWAASGYVLHALDVATEKSGRVTLNEEGLFQVEDADGIPPFVGALSSGEPTASIVISAEVLRQAAAGQEGFVQLNLYRENQALELVGADKYVLAMPAVGMPAGVFWRPREPVSQE